jgi:uncharacterized surface protein with fasciclin (FAS1) repeats
MASLTSTRASRGLAATVLIALLGLAGCSSDDGSSSTAAPNPAPTTPSTSSAPPTDTAPFGPACATLPASGPGSLSAVANEPVATAAGQSPALSTLVTAVSKAGLVDTLNNTQNITVFAPTNEAFAKLPPATLNQVLADQQALTNLLKYHVVGQRTGPAQLDAGSLTTLQGSDIRTAKSGDTYTANDARVLCGGIQTRNATVYLIDTVLVPAS